MSYLLPVLRELLCFARERVESCWNISTSGSEIFFIYFFYLFIVLWFYRWLLGFISFINLWRLFEVNTPRVSRIARVLRRIEEKTAFLQWRDYLNGSKIRAPIISYFALNSV